MKRIALTLLLAACSHHSTPSPSPTPAPAPSPLPNPIPPMPFPIPNPTPAPTPAPSNVVQQVLNDLNVQRSAAGLATVTLNSKLTCAADAHAQDIGPKGSCSHTGSDNSSPFTRISACGYSYSQAGEIIACGQTSADAAVTAWMSDAPHKAIVLGPYTEVGISMVDNYWVVDWGTPL